MSNEQATYRIRIRGHLGRHASAWFPGMDVALQGDGDTVLTGPVADQAALHALLRKTRDLGLTLLGVSRIDPAPGGDEESDLRPPREREERRE